MNEPLNTSVNPDADGLVGAVTEWPSNVLPSTKYRWCDGSLLSRTEFSLLFSRLGELHGVGDGSTTFGIPNLVDKLVRGTDGSSGNEVGTTGGSSAATMPAHDHPAGSLAVSPHSHSGGTDTGIANPGAGSFYGVSASISTSQTGSASPAVTGNTGSAGGSGDNWPPFVRLRHIIKVL